MDNRNLSTYLNDHLAGATAALELLDVLAGVDGLRQVAEDLRSAISEDREQLEAFMRHLSVSVSAIRRVGGWVGEKAAELKLTVDDRGDGALKRLEIFEALGLGVEGKRAMWRALDAAATTESSLSVLNYQHLEERAAQQKAIIERHRIAAVTAALGGIR